MKRINHVYANRLKSSGVVSLLDLQLLSCGVAEKISSWPVNPFFASDDFFRIYLPKEGCFRLMTLSNEIEIRPGAVYLIPAHTPLKFIPVNPCTHYWIHLHSKQLCSLFPPQMICRIRCRGTHKWEKIILELFSVLSGQDTMRAAMRMRHLLDKLIAPFLEVSPPMPGYQHSADQHLQNAVNYIEGHLNQSFSLEQIHQIANMSGSNFLKKFRKRYGCSPEKFIISRRLSKACLLLLQTEKSLVEISFECGYQSISFFSRQFKKYYGTSPGRYRLTGLSKSCG